MRRGPAFRGALSNNREITIHCFGPYFARSRSRSVAAVAAMFALVSAGTAMAAVNAYLFVDGIDGPSTTRPHAIDVLSFSVGVSEAATTGRTGAQATVGKPNCSDLSIMKVLDSASIPLVAAAFTGQTLANVKLVYTRPVLDKDVDYFTLTLSTVMVTSVQESGSNENPTESISLDAKTFTYSFTPQKPDGKLGTPIVFSGSC
jgi:type VI secretion system secreted protein Hcp